MRVDGKFVDADGNKAEGQYVSGTGCSGYPRRRYNTQMHAELTTT
jgi:hypothetical protein